MWPCRSSVKVHRTPVLWIRIRVVEHDDIVPKGLCVRKDFPATRIQFDSVGGLAYEYPVLDQKRVDHGRRGNHEELEYILVDEQYEYHRKDDRIEPTEQFSLQGAFCRTLGLFSGNALQPFGETSFGDALDPCEILCHIVKLSQTDAIDNKWC